MSDTSQPPGLYSVENAQIKGSITATWALALIAVCLRFTARRLSKAGFWYDDWLMIPAQVSIHDIDFSSDSVETLGRQFKLTCVPAWCHGAVFHVCFLE